MSAGLVAEALRASGRVRDAGSPHRFRRAVADFVQVLGAVPDAAVDEVSASNVRALQTFGNDVIERIEVQADETASETQAQSLVSSIYEIRRLLEEIDHWRRHYTIQRSA